MLELLIRDRLFQHIDNDKIYYILFKFEQEPYN